MYLTIFNFVGMKCYTGMPLKTDLKISKHVSLVLCRLVVLRTSVVLDLHELHLFPDKKMETFDVMLSCVLIAITPHVLLALHTSSVSCLLIMCLKWEGTKYR